MAWRRGRWGMGSGVRRSFQLSALDDGALLALVRAGDRHAYGELYTRYERQARMYARSLSGNGADADDAVAEVFVRLLEAIEHGRGPTDSVGGYVLASVRHECAHLARRSTRGAAVTAGDRAQPSAGGSDLATEVAEAAVVRAAFASLPDRVRHILLLTEVDQLPQSQVAARLEADPGTVAVRAMRARRALGSAYLDQHRAVNAHGGLRRRACSETQTNLVAYVRGTLGSRRRVRTEAHLRACSDCRAQHDELQRLNTRLRTVGGWSLLAWIRTIVEATRSAIAGAVATAPAATTILAAAGMSLVVAPAPAAVPTSASHRERALTSSTAASVGMPAAAQLPLVVARATASGTLLPETGFPGLASVGGGPVASSNDSPDQARRPAPHPDPLLQADTSPPTGSLADAEHAAAQAPSVDAAGVDSQGRPGDGQGANKGDDASGADDGGEDHAVGRTDAAEKTEDAAKPKKSGRSGPSGQADAAGETDAPAQAKAAGQTTAPDPTKGQGQGEAAGQTKAGGPGKDAAQSDDAGQAVVSTVADDGSGPSDTKPKHGG
jgi:RNA polymerase sigma factor (sigma-70 family)